MQKGCFYVVQYSFKAIYFKLSYFLRNFASVTQRFQIKGLGKTLF